MAFPTELVSKTATGITGNGDSGLFDPQADELHISSSANGRYIAFESLASNLSGTTDSNGVRDILLKDMWTGALRLVSSSSTGVIGTSQSFSPDVSNDGQYVAFQSPANFPEAENYSGLGFYSVVYRKNMVTGELEAVSLKSSDGKPTRAAHPEMTGDGRFIVFDSGDNGLLPGLDGTTHVFIRDMNSQQVRLVSESAAGVDGNSHSDNPSVSDDGRYVAFTSSATNLGVTDTNGKNDIYVKDLQSGTVRLASVSDNGVQGNGRSENATISANGRYVVFESLASNLVDGKTTAFNQVFRKDLVTGAVDIVSQKADGTVNNHNAFVHAISAEGRYVLFYDGIGSNLTTENHTNYIKDMQTGALIGVNASAYSFAFATLGAGNLTLSASGQYVVLSSQQALDGDGSNDRQYDVFRVNVGTPSGNSGPNTLTGSASDDVLLGLGGNDTLDGKAGNDTLDGGTGADKMTGGSGNDIYFVDNTKDSVIELLNGGNDTVNASIHYTLGHFVEKLILTGTSALNGTGNELANTLTGNSAANTLKGLAGNDTLNGGAGNDSLDGGAGADKMTGGSGNDLYFVDNSGDTVIELFNGGTDTVHARISQTLSANVEKLILEGTSAINGTGNALANTLTGNSAANPLKGLEGSDTLTGGKGNDKFIFTKIADSLAGAGRDVITDFSAGDKIDLSAMDADAQASGKQDFAFVTTGGTFSGNFSSPGDLYFDETNKILYGNTDADVQADFSIKVNLLGLTTLAAGDFVF